METADRKVFDLHCDTLTRCAKEGFGLRNRELHFSLDRLPAGMRLCQSMAIFLPDRYRGREAVEYFDLVYEVYRQQLLDYRDEVEPVPDAAQVDRILERKRFALMLTVEGGAVLAGELENVDKMHRCGVKMITLTWNGANEICGGADTSEGFSPFGREAVGRMEELGIAVDASHLSDRGFYQLCEFATVPFAASHSNSRAVCNHRRNLTDDMFRIIVKMGGVVGLNYYTHFIAEEGNTKNIDDLLRHVHHFLELGGEDTVALGSDFDGADLPPYLEGVESLEFLARALEQSGISRQVVDKMMYGNASRYFTALEERAGRRTRAASPM